MDLRICQKCWSTRYRSKYKQQIRFLTWSVIFFVLDTSLAFCRITPRDYWIIIVVFISVAIRRTRVENNHVRYDLWFGDLGGHLVELGLNGTAQHKHTNKKNKSDCFWNLLILKDIIKIYDFTVEWI